MAPFLKIGAIRNIHAHVVNNNWWKTISRKIRLRSSAIPTTPMDQCRSGDRAWRRNPGFSRSSGPSVARITKEATLGLIFANKF